MAVEQACPAVRPDKEQLYPFEPESPGLIQCIFYRLFAQPHLPIWPVNGDPQFCDMPHFFMAHLSLTQKTYGADDLSFVNYRPPRRSSFFACSIELEGRAHRHGRGKRDESCDLGVVDDLIEPPQMLPFHRNELDFHAVYISYDEQR